MTANLEDRMAVAEHMCGEARGEAATWRSMSIDANERAQDLHSQLWTESTACTAEDEQRRMYEEEAQRFESEQSSVNNQVEEALSALSTMRKDLACAREREWRGGIALEVLDETQQELAEVQSSEKKASEQLAALPKLRSELREATSSLEEARAQASNVR